MGACQAKKVRSNKTSVSISSMRKFMFLSILVASLASAGCDTFKIRPNIIDMGTQPDLITQPDLSNPSDMTTQPDLGIPTLPRKPGIPPLNLDLNAGDAGHLWLLLASASS
jgi:hypothetical protein